MSVLEDVDFFASYAKSLQLSDSWADTEIPVDGANGCISALLSLKADYTHLKVILSIGGGGEPGGTHFPQIASNDSSRQIFSQAVKNLVDAHGFDGVDSKFLGSNSQPILLTCLPSRLGVSRRPSKRSRLHTSSLYSPCFSTCSSLCTYFGLTRRPMGSETYQCGGSCLTLKLHQSVCTYCAPYMLTNC